MEGNSSNSHSHSNSNSNSNSSNSGKGLEEEEEDVHDLFQYGTFPCTALGCIELLREHDIPLRGKKVTVLGRSHIVGLPTALLALHCNSVN